MTEKHLWARLADAWRGKEDLPLSQEPPRLYSKSAVQHIRRAASGSFGRNFAGTNQDGYLGASWSGTITGIDDYLRNGLVRLRSHSRRLAMNNDYMRSFLRMVQRNVVGADGISLQMRCTNRKGEADQEINKQIEAAWMQWSKHRLCTVTGEYSLTELLRVIMTAIARDGEVLLRQIRGFDGNDWRYALQLIPADNLDESKNIPPSANQNQVVIGVEKDG